MGSPQIKRRWYQFSLWTMLVVMTIAAGVFGIWAYMRERERERQAALTRVIAIVDTYDGYIEGDHSITFEKKGLKGEELKSFLDDLRWWGDLGALHLEESGMNDQNMKQLGKVRSLTGLKLKDTQITDEGLRELSGLTDLVWINLENCAVTDIGLKHLSKLSKLEYLEIEGTQITPDGKSWIKEILPNLQINPKFGSTAPSADP